MAQLPLVWVYHGPLLIYLLGVAAIYFHHGVNIINSVYEPGSKLLVLGMVIQPLIGNPYNGYINPYYWVDFPIPYYMEIMGVDRPDRTYNKQHVFPSHLVWGL